MASAFREAGRRLTRSPLHSRPLGSALGASPVEETDHERLQDPVLWTSRRLQFRR